MGLANNSVAVNFANVPAGTCTPADMNVLVTVLRSITTASVTATGNTSYYNFGDTEPSANNRIYPWLKTISGFPDNWYVYKDGAWRPTNPQRLWNTGTTTGAADTYSSTTLQTYPSATTLTVGDVFLASINVTNTGASTLAVNGLAAANVKYGASNLVAGQLQQNVVAAMMWDGTNFQLLNPFLTGLPVYVTNSAAGNGSALAGTPTLIGSVSLTLPTGKTWQSVKVDFSTFMPSPGSPNHGGIQDMDVYVGGVTLGLFSSVRSGYIYSTQNSDDNFMVSASFQGVPTGHDTDNPLTLQMYATLPVGATSGDATASRQILATGYAQ